MSYIVKVLSLESIRRVGEAQARAREVILDAAQTVRPGDTEQEVVRRIEALFSRAGVHKWLHTPYAWFGDRTRFAGFHPWEPNALPTERRLADGEPFILDAAPLVNGYPADFAFSSDTELLAPLKAVKARIVELAKSAEDGSVLFDSVGEELRSFGVDLVHPMYPAGVLGHSLNPFPNAFEKVPVMGRGFQWPLLGSYAVALIKHHLLSAPYPFINGDARGPLRGLFAVEPHIGKGALGAKFESVLLIDGDETRWLDPELFGEVRG